MTTRALFLLYFAIGVAFIGLAQVYLLCKIYRLLRSSRLRPRSCRLLFGAVCAFFILMYLPYPLRLIYKWPEQEVSAFVLYGLLYPFSLWGMASVSTFLIIFCKDVGAALLHTCRRPSLPQVGADKAPQSRALATRRDFL